MLTQSKLLDQMINSLSATLDPSEYIRSIGVDPFAWQDEALNPGITRLMLLCARQSGKSTVVAGKSTNKAKYQQGLNIILAPSEKQSKETMKKVDDYISADPELNQSLKKDSTFEKEFANGSRIIALPGTETSVRGYSGPKTIIIDEASYVEDATYNAIRPMLTGNVDGELILLSTPKAKHGFFHREWTKNPVWTKIMVKPRWDLQEDMMTFAENMPEEEYKAYWAKKGVSAYYSPRHALDWLKEELASVGPLVVKREYNCEFLDDAEAMFSRALIESMYSDTVEVYEPEEVQYSDAIPPADFLKDLFAPQQYQGHDFG